MGLLDAIWQEPVWRRKAVHASPEVLEAASARNLSFIPLIATPNRGDQMRQAFERTVAGSYGWMYASQPAVRSVVDYIAQNVAQLALRLYERTSDIERHEDSDHPAAVALRNPNAFTPGQKFIFNMVRDHLVYANAYALKFREGSSPLMFAQLPPHRVSVIGPAYFTVDAYRVYRADGTTLEPDVRPENMLHWVGSPNPEDPRLGLSPLETLRQLLAEEATSQAANVELLKSGLLEPGYVSRPAEVPQLSPEAAERFTESWANAVKNVARKTPLLEEGMEFHAFGVSPKDAQMLAGREFTRDEVAREYGMVHCPPQSEEERAQFISDVLAPLCEMFCAFLDLSVVKGEFLESRHYFEFDLDEKLTGNDRLTALTSASGAPVLTRNESRAMLNKPPKEGGDELITPMNVTVGGKPSPQVMPIQDPNGPVQDGSARNGNQSMNGRGKALLLARREKQRQRRDRHARDLTKALSKFFADQERSRQTKALEAPRWVKVLTTILVGLMKAIVREEGAFQAGRLGLAGFDTSQVQHYLEVAAAAKAQEINDALEHSLAHGDTTEVFEDYKTTRAEGIGTSIATRMTSFAAVEAAKQAPDFEVRRKTWVVADQETSAHPEMDGEERDLFEEFSNHKQYPPYEHPRCKCLVDIH